MLRLYSFSLRVHSEFKNSVKPPRAGVLVFAEDPGTALEMAMDTFRSWAKIPDGVDIRVMSRTSGNRAPIGTRAGAYSFQPQTWLADRMAKIEVL